MSNRNIKVEGAPMGACPLEDPNSSSKASLRQSTSSKKISINIQTAESTAYAQPEASKESCRYQTTQHRDHHTIYCRTY
jgi:hypothetical protein